MFTPNRLEFGQQEQSSKAVIGTLQRYCRKEWESMTEKNFTKDIDDIKDRIGDIESFAERTGSDFAEIKALRKAEKDENKLDLNSVLGDLSEDDLDIIIEKSIREISIDRKIDAAIDDFIETLKDWNMN